MRGWQALFALVGELGEAVLEPLDQIFGILSLSFGELSRVLRETRLESCQGPLDLELISVNGDETLRRVKLQLAPRLVSNSLKETLGPANELVIDWDMEGLGGPN